jgi:hypothetical protein
MWDELWARVKRHDYDTLLWLTPLLSFGFLSPPDWTDESQELKDRLFDFRKKMSILSIYATLGRDRYEILHGFFPRGQSSVLKFAADMIADMIALYPHSGAAEKKVGECFGEASRGARSGGGAQCVRPARKLGVVPEFDDFMRELDDAARSSGKPASCGNPGI